MKLKVFLKMCDDRMLRGICDFWHLQPENKPDRDEAPDLAGIIEFLYPRIQSAQYFKTAFSSLSQDDKDFVTFIAMHGGILGRQEIIERCLDGKESAFDEFLDRPSLYGFCIREELKGDYGEIIVCMPDCHVKQIKLPPHLRGYLGYFLSAQTTPRLSELAEILECPDFKSQQRHVLQYHIRQTMTDPDCFQTYVGSLPDELMELFKRLLDKNGSCLYGDLLESANHRHFEPSKAEYLNDLINNRRLVFALSEGANKYANMLIIPRDLFYTISEEYKPDNRPFKDLDSVSVADEEPPPSAVHERAGDILRDIALAAAFFQTNNLKRIVSGGVSAYDLKRVLPSFGGKRIVKYAQFLCAFMRANKFLIEVGGLWKVSESFESWLADPATCYSNLFGWWRTTSDWRENSLEGIVEPGASTPPTPVGDITEIRRIILAGMTGLPTDRWNAFKSFFDTVGLQGMTVLSHSGDARFESRTGKFLSRLIENMLVEPLNWLGIVAIGVDESSRSRNHRHINHGDSKDKDNEEATPDYKGRFSFQVTPLGHAVLSVAGADRSPVPQELNPQSLPLFFASNQFIVQPTLEIIAPPDLSLVKRYRLAQICVIRNADVVTTFELTRDSVDRCLDKGMHAEEIERFLAESSRVGLPETASQLICECLEQHDQLRVGTAGGYIRVGDPMMIEQIKSTPKLALFIKDIIGNHCIIIPENIDISRLAREMRNAGMSPRVDSDVVHATSDERYHLTLEPEELYDLLAAMRLVWTIEQEFGADISQGRTEALAQKLKPETARFQTFHKHTEAIFNAYLKRFNVALEKRIDEASEKLRSQVSRLMTRRVGGRGPSKYHFTGANPAVEREDIIKLLKFAAEHEFESEILYVRQNNQETTLHITPKSFMGQRVYAHCVETDSDAIYSLDRLLHAKL
ncbi:MAG: helicase-associated domain-containing protein [bacterium]